MLQALNAAGGKGGSYGFICSLPPLWFLLGGDARHVVLRAARGATKPAARELDANRMLTLGTENHLFSPCWLLIR